MSDDAYRSGFRVETRVRDLTDDENALVQARLGEWNARVRKQAMRRVRELVYALPFAIGLVILAARNGWDGVTFSAGMMSVFFALLVFVARRQALRTIAASRGPWHAPEGGWKMRDTRVVARSMTTVRTECEDRNAIWLLYEVPGGDWFYVDSLCLPLEKKDFARADVHLTRLWPDGVYVDVTRMATRSRRASSTRCGTRPMEQPTARSPKRRSHPRFVCSVSRPAPTP